jgi:DMSO/TMAO reductase YedYZ molybdopterin-dependent catalytic subunit
VSSPAAPADAVRAALTRADDLLKAAPNRNDPDAALTAAAEVLEGARDHLDDVADASLRRDLAVQIARRMGDIDATTFAAVEPAPGMRRAPTDVDDPSRVPPGQRLTPGWPVLHVGAAPTFDPDTWNFTVTGKVDRRVRWDWEGFRALPATTVTSDFHCVTHWSRLDNVWEGVLARDVLAVAGTRTEATHAVVTGHPAYAANLPLDALLADDVLFAWAVDGRALPAVHGGPLRLVVPSRYGWKSVKWVFEVRLTDRDVPGYWEERGYHDNADPWREQRFRA